MSSTLPLDFEVSRLLTEALTERSEDPAESNHFGGTSSNFNVQIPGFGGLTSEFGDYESFENSYQEHQFTEFMGENFNERDFSNQHQDEHGFNYWRAHSSPTSYHSDASPRSLPESEMESFLNYPTNASPSSSSVSSPPSRTHPNSQSHITVLCNVCYTPTGKHSFYGGQVCESCRGFFRRAVKTKRRVPCEGNGRCAVDSKSRRSCTWCRYQRCLEAGMKPHLVARKEGANTEEGGKQVVAARMSSSPMLITPFMEMTLEENLRITREVTSLKHNFFGAMCEMLLEDISPMMTIVKMIIFKTSVGPSAIKSFERTERRAWEKVTFNLEAMENVIPEDRTVMINNSFAQFFSILANSYLGHKGFVRCIKEYLGYIRENKCSNAFYRGLLGQFEKLDLSETKKVFKYDKVYVSPWSSSSELEEKHRELTARIKRWTGTDAEDTFDEPMVLLSIMCHLFSSEGLSLVDERPVQMAQKNFMKLLFRYLRDRYGEKARSIMNSCLMVNGLAKECYEIHSQMLPV